MKHAEKHSDERVVLEYLENPCMPLIIFLGFTGYGLGVVSGSSLADPLVISLFLGILAGTMFSGRYGLRAGNGALVKLLVPVGIVFYALENINLAGMERMLGPVALLLVLVMAAFAGTIAWAGRRLGQRQAITALTAIGSAVCGASAIVISSYSVEAEPDDVSISLLSITAAALAGLFLFLPFLGLLLGLDNAAYAYLSGAVLQFTGFVKAAAVRADFLPQVISESAARSSALLVKSFRYLGLIVLIPVFASLKNGRFSLPLAVWLYILAGTAGVLLHAVVPDFYETGLRPLVRPGHLICWSVVMAHIGSLADIRKLISSEGVKALMLAFAGFFAGVAVFLAGYLWLL